MVLDNTEAAKIIAKNPQQKTLDAARLYTKKMLMHIKGIGLDTAIEQAMSFEKIEKVIIRKKYAVSNQSLFSRIHRPIDKVFAAKGGSVYYSTSAANQASLKLTVSNIVFGYSLKQWLEIFWMPAMQYDPMGLIMMEIDANDSIYPTYKSINDIFAYGLNGRNVDYVIFKVDKSALPKNIIEDSNDVYRIYDDVSDRLVRMSNGVLSDIPNQTYPNFFGRVPATIISNIYDPTKGFFISPDDDVIELADQFLREGSVKNIYKQYFGFPRAWEYASSCPDCAGEGVVNGSICPSCKGSKVKTNSDPSETIRIPVPTNRDQPMLAPHLGGYITPDIQGWDAMTKELVDLEDIMFRTLWGTQQVDDKANETATGRFIDTQPVNDRLNKFSDAAEMMEVFITNLIGEHMFNTYGGTSSTWGRRFMVESADKIWLKLENARKTGAPTVALYDLYKDYLQSRYSSNAIELQRLLLLAKIEPLPFVKYEEFAKLATFPDIILRKKFWFESWLCSKTDAEIQFGQFSVLQADFELFCKDQDILLETDLQLNPTLNPPTESKSAVKEPIVN